MELKKHYEDRDFHYSCPECREGTKDKKRDKKALRKKQQSYKSENKSVHKRRCTENNSSAFSNSGEIESNKPKNCEFHADVNMVNVNSQLDDEIAEDSYYSQVDVTKRASSEIGIESIGQSVRDSRKIESKKKKQLKKSKSGNIKIKRMAKRNTEDLSSND